MILKMNTIFDIDELVGHILSFVPRKFIVSCVLVNKRFNKMVKVDNDYENVVRNTDFYSLNKIKYHPSALMIIAKKYRNFDLMEWMLRYKMKLFRNSGNKENFIGFVGKEEFFDDITGELIEGMCEGMHFDLLEKHRYCFGYYNAYEVIKFASKMGDIIANKIFSILKISNNSSNIEKIIGNCSRTDKNHVKTYIDIIHQLFPNNPYIYEYICDGLIEGGHLDIFIEFHKEYLCKYSGPLKKLIINNDYEFFKFVIMNNCEVTLYDNIKICDDFSNEFDWESCYHLVIDCIHFKRVNIILFLINEITFSLEFYNKFLNEARMLEFDDIEKVFIDNSKLFKTLRKSSYNSNFLEY
jgi:hypothetical protein